LIEIIHITNISIQCMYYVIFNINHSYMCTILTMIKNIFSALSFSKKDTKYNVMKYFIVTESQPSVWTIIFILYLLTTAQLARVQRQYRKQNCVMVGR